MHICIVRGTKYENLAYSCRDVIMSVTWVYLHPDAYNKIIRSMDEHFFTFCCNRWKKNWFSLVKKKWKTLEMSNNETWIPDNCHLFSSIKYKSFYGSYSLWVDRMIQAVTSEYITWIIGLMLKHCDNKLHSD